MLILMASLTVLALSWVAFALVTGRSLAPEALMRNVVSTVRSLVRWLWRQRPQRGGGGRLRQPRIRYRD